jgi:D-alanyl-D-alanine carboxypeptidase
MPASANSKYAAFVAHADSGDVYFDRYSTEPRHPASLTKMMTLYLLFEAMEAGEFTADSKLTVSAQAAGQPPSKLGVTAGSTIDADAAIKALVIRSANDVAVVVAEALGGSEWRFAQDMTNKARALGMGSTTFRNASGLPNSKQVTNARDMAVLARRLVQDFPQYFHYFSLQSFSWNGKTYTTHNGLVKTYEGADGMKTGYTRHSGFNLVTTANRDGERLIGVVLGGRSTYTRDQHMRLILDNAFAAIESEPALVAALHRQTPHPRLKPTLLAARAGPPEAPTLAGNAALQQEIFAAASSMGDAPETPAPAQAHDDPLRALIAAADADDFNEYEGVRIAALAMEDEFLGEGDRETLNGPKWSVQIGAYSSKMLAQDELETAAVKGALTDRPRAVLPTPQEDGKILYRARFTKMSEIEAAASCADLQEKNISCFVISDGDVALQ